MWWHSDDAAAALLSSPHLQESLRTKLDECCRYWARGGGGRGGTLGFVGYCGVTCIVTWARAKQAVQLWVVLNETSQRARNGSWLWKNPKVSNHPKAHARCL